LANKVILMSGSEDERL